MSRSTVERAFELARAGGAPDFPALKARLKADGCRAVDALLANPSIQRHLQAICVAAWSRPDGSRPDGSRPGQPSPLPSPEDRPDQGPGQGSDQGPGEGPANEGP